MSNGRMALGDLADVTPERFRHHPKVPFDLFNLCVVHLRLYSLIDCKMQRDSSMKPLLELITRAWPEGQVTQA